MAVPLKHHPQIQEGWFYQLKHPELGIHLGRPMGNEIMGSHADLNERFRAARCDFAKPKPDLMERSARKDRFGEAKPPHTMSWHSIKRVAKPK